MSRTHLINRKAVAFVQDRRPLERLSGIYEIASKDITVGTRVRHKGRVGPDEMVVNGIGPDGTVWCVGWHSSEVKRYKLPVTALETLGKSTVMKKLITLGSRVRRKGENGPEMVVVGVQRDNKLVCEWRDGPRVVRRKFAVAALENLDWDQEDRS